MPKQIKIEEVLNNCKALLFDKDGTLLNFKLLWLGWSCQVADDVCRRFSLSDPDKLLENWGVDIGQGHIAPSGFLAIGSTGDLERSMAAGVIAPDFSRNEIEREVRLAMDEAYKKAEISGHVQHIENVPAVIEELFNRGYLMAVVTTDDTGQAINNLEKLNIRHYFHVVLGCDSVKNCKPAPDLVLQACRLLNVEPSRVAVIGDTPADMEMGRRAEVAYRVGVSSGVATPQELIKGGASLVLESVASMLNGQ